MIKRNILNKILLLKLISQANLISGATRLQKIVFEIESKNRLQGLNTFNYKYIRWHYGPYSAELIDDIDFLEEKELITSDANIYTITQKGKSTILKAEKTFNELNITEEQFNEVLAGSKNKPLSELLDRIYQEYKIEEDYNKGDTILSILSKNETGEII